ncbi:hypothetical protein HK105_207617 [Polyrhizophydium stewartii]|uniref:Uncharacterized protein n=1 Tax=Polyrhizophydium stewartii TaxID=2732419 RepID=A0ABR4MZY2_9FUNG
MADVSVLPAIAPQALHSHSVAGTRPVAGSTVPRLSSTSSAAASAPSATTTAATSKSGSGEGGSGGGGQGIHLPAGSKGHGAVRSAQRSAHAVPRPHPATAFTIPVLPPHDADDDGPAANHAAAAHGPAAHQHRPDHDNNDDDDPFSYRHYNAYHPTCNKLLSKKWEERSRLLHLKKLKDVRPTIDNAPPKVYPHLEMRLKKLKLEEDRLVDIKRKNQILLERIAFQMVRISEVGRKGQLQTPAIRSFYSNEKRRRDNAMIATQNEIFERIENKSPFYNRFEWLADRRRNLGYLKNISQYPKHYCQLIQEFDTNEDLARISRAATRSGATRAQTAMPALRGKPRPMTAGPVRPHTNDHDANASDSHARADANADADADVGADADAEGDADTKRAAAKRAATAPATMAAGGLMGQRASSPEPLDDSSQTETNARHAEDHE